MPGETVPKLPVPPVNMLVAGLLGTAWTNEANIKRVSYVDFCREAVVTPLSELVRMAETAKTPVPASCFSSLTKEDVKSFVDKQLGAIS